MNFLISYLRSKSWIHNFHRWYWSNIKYPLWDIWFLVILSKLFYFIRYKYVRSRYGKRKLRVVFPVSNTAKWKCQTLFDLMAKSDKYDPTVVLTPMDIASSTSPDELSEIIEKAKDFFDNRGCKWVLGYDCKTRVFYPFSDLKADIVWYTQPWGINVVQDVLKTSKRALTCYTPYFVQNYGCLDMECDLPFHRMLWRHFTLSDAWANEFEKYQGIRHAGRVVGLGHPMLDNFYLAKDKVFVKKYVIYAPHFSCNVAECFSTFLNNGREMLELAKAHPDIKWVFKPHPTLRTVLFEMCGWTKQEIDEYYTEWENVAVACYDGNYVDLFNESIAMITDCASFLMEYACSGNPIIHLISANAKYQPHPIAAKLFGSYYQARNFDEFMEHFNEVILRRNDYKKAVRLEAVKDMRLLDNYAAKNILEYLDSLFTAKR